MVIVSISVTIAMYCLIQLYVVVSEQLKPHRPLLKLFSVKAVGEGNFISIRYGLVVDGMVTVFLTFWQATILSVFALFNLVKDVSLGFFCARRIPNSDAQTKYMTAENINIGIGAVLECVEMT